MPHQKFEGERTLMRIHIGESDKWHGKPLHEAIVEMLRKDGFSAATAGRVSTTLTNCCACRRISPSS